MSRQGTGRASAVRTHEFVTANALGRPIVLLARRMLAAGLRSDEVCSLFTQCAATLAQQEDGMPREEWLTLCEELHAESEHERGLVMAPGGAA